MNDIDRLYDRIVAAIRPLEPFLFTAVFIALMSVAGAIETGWQS